MSPKLQIKKSKGAVDISFIIPVYNEEENLPNVLSAIRQFVTNLTYEIIIVDNGSTDSTVSIAQEFGAKVLYNSSSTIAGLRNLGAQSAQGRVLVFIDGDVIITQGWAENISEVLSIIEQDKRVITGSRYGVRTKPSWIEKHWFLPMTQEKANYINGGNLIIDSDVFHEIGGFNDTLITGEDYEFCMRAKQKGIVIINNPKLHVIHEGYPKTLKQFIRREKWHGIQDVYNINSFLKSKPAILSMFYWLSGMAGIILFLYYKSLIYLMSAIFINTAICFLTTLFKRRQYPLSIFSYFLLYHVYFFARGLSLIERLFKIIPYLQIK